MNRALVVEEECAEKYGLDVVNVYPYIGGWRGAGGSCHEQV